MDLVLLINKFEDREEIERDFYNNNGIKGNNSNNNINK